MRYELAVGLRYTRAKRRNRFIGINSAVSMIGIAVGVWALIVVLSVMNGFQKEVRARILGVASHVQITGADNRLADYKGIIELAMQHPRVQAAAPYVQGQAMLTMGGRVRGALVRGVIPEEEDRVAALVYLVDAKGCHDGIVKAPGALEIAHGNRNMIKRLHSQAPRRRCCGWRRSRRRSERRAE